MTQQTHQGVVNANPRGFGFVTTDEGQEYFVPPPSMKYIVPGDRITFTLESGKKPGEFQVDRVLKTEREPSIWLGELEVRNGRFMLVTDDPCFVGIELKNLRYTAPGQVVAVRVSTASGFGTIVQGELVGVIGPRNRAGFDHDYALAREDLKLHYATATLLQARDISPTVDTVAALGTGWRDMRDVPLVTIDGESTQDFDDAVEGRQLSDRFVVRVGIADVSAYVTPGSALDREARERCTSVYLPGLTVPMLPPALSTGVCSLSPGVDRLAVVCTAEVTLDGKLMSWKFERAVIRSHARLTYDQVHQRLRHQNAAPLGSAAVEASLQALDKLYRTLLAARKERGVLEFNDKEPRLKARVDGGYDLLWEERNDAHRLVEELMLLANQAAAAELAKRDVPAFFRHQQSPESVDWTELLQWLGERGVAMAPMPSLKEMALTLEAVKDREDYAVIEARIRKVMRFAVYDTQESSHFSLGYDTYTHFTSPIRRYSDLLTHRLLLGDSVAEDELKAAATRCSEKSRASRFAERFVWDRLKKRILARDVDPAQPMAARVVVVSPRGIKVVFEDWQCAAFIPAEALLDHGMTWNKDQQSWNNGTTLEPGRTLMACWQRLDEEKSRCELSATVA